MERIFIIKISNSDGSITSATLRKPAKDDSIIDVVKKIVRSSYERKNLTKLNDSICVIESLGFHIGDYPTRDYNSSYVYVSSRVTMLFLRIRYRKKEGLTFIYDKMNRVMNAYRGVISIYEYISGYDIYKVVMSEAEYSNLKEFESEHVETGDNVFMVKNERIPRSFHSRSFRTPCNGLISILTNK
jgi:hypothetical protein